MRRALADTYAVKFGENSDLDSPALGQQPGGADSVVGCQICWIQSKYQPVEASEVEDSAVRVSAAGEPRLTLKQKLALFDPERHGGEAMATVRAGREAL